MVAGQANKCAICAEIFTRIPNVDHDHKTGKVRGLLCSNCNIGLGRFQDNELRLYKAQQYLRYHDES